MIYREIQAFDFAALARLEQRLSEHSPTPQAALEFYSRSPHSFLAHRTGEIRGFVLAQAVWQGDQTVVLVRQVVADSEAVYGGLLGQVVQSAYRAGASSVALHADSREASAIKVMAEQGFSFAPKVLAVRDLGREKGEIEAVLE